MSYSIGMIMGFLSLIFAIQILNQPLHLFMDTIALCVVLGGTLAISIIVLPWSYWKEILRLWANFFNPNYKSYKKLVIECLEFISAVKSQQPINIKGTSLGSNILREGFELISLNFKTEDIKTILLERIEQHTDRIIDIANSFKAISKYPPAFGLAGTVLGLVSLMKAITEGLEPKETGIRMAIALIATFYGLITANLIVAPIAEGIFKKSIVDKKQGEIALNAVLFAAQNESLLKAQELLNAYLPQKDKVNYIKYSIEEDMQDAA